MEHRWPSQLTVRRFALAAVGVSIALAGAGVSGAFAQGTRLDSRGLPIGTDTRGNAVNGANNPYVSGTATSPWTQSTNGGTQQVPAPIPPPVTYGGGGTAAPGAAAPRIYGGTRVPREQLGPEYYGSGPTPGRRAFAACIADWSKDSGMSKSAWRATCVRRFYPKDAITGKR